MLELLKLHRVDDLAYESPWFHGDYIFGGAGRWELIMEGKNMEYEKKIHQWCRK